MVIGLGKEKFQTSVQEKVSEDAIWNEEAELYGLSLGFFALLNNTLCRSIPSHGNKAEIHLTVYHRNNGVALDDFLGTVHIPLNNLDPHEPARNR